jgi:dihydroorotate dehydrogenase
LTRVAVVGAGAWTTQSIGMAPLAGHPDPVIVELGHGLPNAMGIPDLGIDE